jgi:hypothetical protein
MNFTDGAASSMPTEPDLLTPRPVWVAQMHREQFTAEFMAWLPENLHVYEAFEREALACVRRGFAHYSARTIIEWLRHHTALTETGGPWKLNDWHTPYLARLFALTNPAHRELFEFRQAKAAKRDHAEVA